MMIKSIDELKNTYVKNTPELRDAFLGVALHFGLIDSASDVGQSSADAVVAYWYNVNGDSFSVGCWYHYAGQIKEECRELTLSDLKPNKEESAVKTLDMLGYVYHGAELWEPPVKKPKTRTEYVKVTESIFDLRDEFERGELYHKFEHAREYSKVNNTEALSQALNCGCCYRKVKKEIDWRESVREFLESCKQISNSSQLESFTYKGGCSDRNVQIENELHDNEFLELCRVTLRALGEL